MNEIKQAFLTGERALFGAHDLEIYDTTLDVYKRQPLLQEIPCEQQVRFCTAQSGKLIEQYLETRILIGVKAHEDPFFFRLFAGGILRGRVSRK